MVIKVIKRTNLIKDAQGHKNDKVNTVLKLYSLVHLTHVYSMLSMY